MAKNKNQGGNKDKQAPPAPPVEKKKPDAALAPDAPAAEAPAAVESAAVSAKKPHATDWSKNQTVLHCGYPYPTNGDSRIFCHGCHAWIQVEKCHLQAAK